MTKITLSKIYLWEILQALRWSFLKFESCSRDKNKRI